MGTKRIALLFRAFSTGCGLKRTRAVITRFAKLDVVILRRSQQNHLRRARPCYLLKWPDAALLFLFLFWRGVRRRLVREFRRYCLALGLSLQSHQCIMRLTRTLHSFLFLAF